MHGCSPTGRAVRAFPIFRKRSSLACPVQHSLCFYCARKFGKAEIDHFIPWSRYPRDLAHNLVLADRQCNSKKSGTLASKDHLERWLQRNSDNDAGIIEAGRAANIIVDGPAAVSVAAWAYSHGLFNDLQSPPNYSCHAQGYMSGSTPPYVRLPHQWHQTMPDPLLVLVVPG
jgi:hypothetical protein